MNRFKCFMCSCFILTLFIFIPLAIAQDLQSQGQKNKILFELKCAKCHSLDKALSKTKDFLGWNRTTQRMAKKNNSDINQTEAEEIAGYLANQDKKNKDVND